MSHPDQIDFVKICSTMMSSSYPQGKVIEIGSYCVNGDVRQLFSWAEKHIGIDLAEGPGVDEISSGHEYGKSNYFDVSIACEVFEHNPFWMETFINMIRITKPGGTILFTCATNGRVEHGTQRTTASDSPGTASIGWTYYQNLSAKDFIKRIDMDNHFTSYKFFVSKRTFDLYFIGVKKDYINSYVEKDNWIDKGSGIISASIVNINSQKKLEKNRHPVITTVVMIPIQIARLILSDKNYQDFHFNYIKYKNKIRNILF